MFMPCPFNLVFVRFHNLRQSVHFLASEVLIVREANGAQPELRTIPVLSHMHMNRFPRIAFVGEEEKTITLEQENAWHGWMLAHRFPFCPPATRLSP
jgi:hypothetical protein